MSFGWPAVDAEYIPISELKHRRLYRLSSRNLFAGFWNAHAECFTGIRLKFGSKFLDAEYHWDAPLALYKGTAKPLEDLAVDLSENIGFNLTSDKICTECGTPVERVVLPESEQYGGIQYTGDTHLDTIYKESCPREGTACGYYKVNQELFDILDPWDEKYAEEASQWNK